VNWIWKIEDPYLNAPEATGSKKSIISQLDGLTIGCALVAWPKRDVSEGRTCQGVEVVVHVEDRVETWDHISS